MRSAVSENLEEAIRTAADHVGKAEARQEALLTKKGFPLKATETLPLYTART